MKVCVACRDCKYHFTGPDLYDTPMCWADRSADPLTGKPIGQKIYDMRAAGGKCGPDARLFVPEPSFLKRLWRKFVEFMQ
jgi:hypothetical protein